MKQVLISFLGRTPLTEKGGYRTTRYDYGDGVVEDPVAFFGWSLRQRLRPDRMVILGTAGSMWDHLIEGDIDLGSAEQEARDRLIEATHSKNVDDDMVGIIAPVLSQALGCEIDLKIIPYCRNETEQVELLRILADHVHPGDRVHLDVSHGFRHLPMLALVSAMHLRMVRKVTVEGVWYGAYDPDTGYAPVHNLLGLLRIAEWIQALQTYDKDGDYGVIAPLLGAAGGPLAQAAFFERTSNPVRAREKLTEWASSNPLANLDQPEVVLFGPELEERLRWYRERDRAGWESSLARQYLRTGDYVRAAIYGQEAVVSREGIRQKGNINDFDQRKEILDEERKRNKDFKTLTLIRNALAHGVKQDRSDIRKIVTNPDRLPAKLKELFKNLGLDDNADVH